MPRRNTTLRDFIPEETMERFPVGEFEHSRIVVLQSVGKQYETPVVFFKPRQGEGEGTEEETCPITTGPLWENVLEGYEDVSIFPEDPELTGVRLECRHCFNAVALVYHWMSNGMECPVCKRGEKVRLAIGNFSGEWAEKWALSIQNKQKYDTLEQMRESESDMWNQMVIELLYVEGGGSPGARPLSQVLQGGAVLNLVCDVTCVVYFYDTSEFPTSYVEVPMRVSDECSALMSRHVGARLLSREIERLSPRALRFTLTGKHVDNSVSSFCNTPRIPLNAFVAERENTFFDVVNGGRFDIRSMPLIEGHPPSISSITCVPGPQQRFLVASTA